MSNNDGPFYQFKHRGSVIHARRVKRVKVIQTDREKIVLHPGDWEIIGTDGTSYGNTDDQFTNHYEPVDDEAQEYLSS